MLHLTSWRHRVLIAVSLALGLALLMLSLSSATGAARKKATAEVQNGLNAMAARESNALSEYFIRARTAVLLLAQNPAFPQLLADPDTPAPSTRSAAEAGLEYLESLYPTSIQEACVFDLHGRELARVVDGKAAPVEDLAADESNNAFFSPTLGLPVGGVHQARPYLSPDTHNWVVSNSAVLRDDAGRPVGVLHFEVKLSSFLDRLSATESLRVIDREGHVVLDSRNRAIPATTPTFAAEAARFGERGDVTLGGQRSAYHAVAQQPGNINHWYVVASSPGHVSAGLGLTGSAGLAATAALLMMALAVGSLRGTQRRLRVAATTDALTGLANRPQFLAQASEALHQDHRRGHLTAIAVIDLDRFKEVNDALGHAQGDELLKQVGPRIRTALRSRDVLARLGGDEFALLLADVPDEATARAIAQRIVQALEEPFELGEVRVAVEASVGLAMSSKAAVNLNDLLQRADVAMYRAKEQRSGVACFDVEGQRSKPLPLTLLGELREALERGELILHYQPIVTLASQQVQAVEALIRWEHPRLGLLQPDAFMPIAESSALIRPLTRHALRTALQQCRTWLEAGLEIQVGVNLSPQCLTDDSVVELVRKALHEFGVPPHLLMLEVVESAIITDPLNARAVLKALRFLGVKVAVDDFGTGYSSLSHLTDLPFDELKIDRSFVFGMATDERLSVIVRSLVAMAHSLGHAVVAEGVENETTLRLLRAAGCDRAQGYFWSAAVPAEKLTSKLGLPKPASDARRLNTPPAPRGPSISDATAFAPSRQG